MAELHQLRIRTAEWSPGPSYDQLLDVARQINENAAHNRMIGRASPCPSPGTYQSITHVVLPTAVVVGTSILVEIELLETGGGALIKELIRSGASLQGLVRGQWSPPKLIVYSVDIDIRPTSDLTVLDDIVEALEDSDLSEQ